MAREVEPSPMDSPLHECANVSDRGGTAPGTLNFTRIAMAGAQSATTENFTWLPADAPLPIRLTSEPLVDAIFEVRFVSQAPATSILPGVLYAKLGAPTKIERLPPSEVPEAIRLSEPTLQYVPLLRLVYEQYFVLVGDRSVLVAAKLPYCGWQKFKDFILYAMTEALGPSFVSHIERYSIKYVNVIPGDDVPTQMASLRLGLLLGDNRVNSPDAIQLQFEFKAHGFSSILSFAAPVTWELIGFPSRAGMALTIDTVCNRAASDVAGFVSELPSRLEEIRSVNKRTFFSCLSPATLTALGPIYANSTH
jgi:uncharacterized protein (TIGR04255 family)